MSNICVALFVYNRPTHTANTLAALAKNPEAANTPLVIFSDGARDSTHVASVTAVRTLLANVRGFKDVRIVCHEGNLGLSQSIIQGVSEVINAHGRVIVLEDDLVTSPHFLRYMNQALAFYENDDRVISIHGYVYPTNRRLPETFFLRGADCWGWGTWRRGWDLFEPNATSLVHEIRNRGLRKRFDHNNSYPFFKMLRNQAAGKTDSWAIRWHASAFSKGKLTLYPGRSLVRNIGIDRSGTNVRVATNAFDVSLSQTPVVVEPIPVAESAVAEEAFETFFRSLRIKRLLATLRRFLPQWGCREKH
jgi:hypothetical protein